MATLLQPQRAQLVLHPVGPRRLAARYEGIQLPPNQFCNNNETWPTQFDKKVSTHFRAGRRLLAGLWSLKLQRESDAWNGVSHPGGTGNKPMQVQAGSRSTHSIRWGSRGAAGAAAHLKTVEHNQPPLCRLRLATMWLSTCPCAFVAAAAPGTELQPLPFQPQHGSVSVG